MRREPPLGAATGGGLCVPLTARSGSESLGRALVRGRALAGGRALARGGYCQGAGPARGRAFARGRALAGAGPRCGGALAALTALFRGRGETLCVGPLGWPPTLTPDRRTKEGSA